MVLSLGSAATTSPCGFVFGTSKEKKEDYLPLVGASRVEEKIRGLGGFNSWKTVAHTTSKKRVGHTIEDQEVYLVLVLCISYLVN